MKIIACLPIFGLNWLIKTFCEIKYLISQCVFALDSAILFFAYTINAFHIYCHLNLSFGLFILKGLVALLVNGQFAGETQKRFLVFVHL